MQDFRNVVQSYGIAVSPEDDIPYSSTTVALLAFYFHEAELARVPGKSEEIIELLTSMIRKATACHMEDNCTLEVIPDTTFVVHDGGTTSGFIAKRFTYLDHERALGHVVPDVSRYVIGFSSE